ncbi:MAG: hypothetical protein A2600_05675 [Candidatus Lambdaproteobacteria bacterium RIFOXYD1_FULL_56_27]|uniref:DNA-directed DNA polymerase n=1 Tax=Candidatus Lambdaproteobacteria bacterium RIFOXYD2_FULL_56_26 TaxID=1817773 RepID=A0A1F6GRI7_9PROT|nr:MAG: hypothetical protein A2426_10880 [Candidatus Lambdaproteobacteria bacterium RIFOXYC1_FULL_56_13]OGH00690.1 MAG: hypothetical protein A2557_03380 [Candidatus Lambdaproteobacteria bacterium RIFOXYD2_FULL_56_26]OGH07857.1 MAG: hypothetical protein A2600_05675 [Candidatus Lambdaproteobacteria bacterium RIFOXYD1_FULL_56_27]
MIDSIFQLLFRHEKPLTQNQIAKFLGLKVKEETLEQMGQDPRFCALPQEQWAATALEDLIEDLPLTETSFVITDIETTGSIRGTDRIIDLAAVKIKGDKELGRFEALVNPHRRISRHITQLTGISNQDVETAPLIEEVMPQFLEFVGDAVFVAHNAPFDFYFIQAEIKRLGLEPMKKRVPICTFAIAKKLLPELKACGVTGLSKHFGYESEDRHRAMPDVLATRYFLGEFIKELEEKGITRLHQLIQFQKDGLSREQIQKRIKRQESKRRQTRAPSAKGA